MLAILNAVLLCAGIVGFLGGIIIVYDCIKKRKDLKEFVTGIFSIIFGFIIISAFINTII